MPGAEKSIDILQLLYAIKKSKEELEKLCSRWIPILADSAIQDSLGA